MDNRDIERCVFSIHSQQQSSVGSHKVQVMRNKTFDHNVEKEWLQDSGVLHNETRRYLSLYFEKKTASKLALEKSKCEMTIELLITKHSGEEKK